MEKMVANNAFMIEEMKEKVKKQDRLEIVRNAIKLGMDDETISKLTGLSIEEVAKIRVKN